MKLDPSSEHVNVDASVAEKVKVAEPDVTVPEGPESIVVSGGVVSAGGTLTVQVLVAGDASVLPAASVARTLNVCDPFARPE